MNYDLYELIGIVLLIGMSVFSLYFVISEMMFNKAVQKQREILRQHKLRNRLAKVDPLYIKDCLIRGYNSDLLSYPARKLINKIIDGMETISVKVN